MPQPKAPTNRTHGTLQAGLARLIGNFLAETGGGTIVVEPGIVPRIQAGCNVRVPDLAVTCSSYDIEESASTDPVLLIEILSPSNQAETWANVWSYTTIPSVRREPAS